MKEQTAKILERLFEDVPSLVCCRSSLVDAFLLIKSCYEGRGQVLICGNGGSAADAEHITGELMKGFLLKRKLKEADCSKLKAAYPNDWQYLFDNLQGALPAISLVSHTALSTAFTNDVSPDMVFAQQVYGYGKPGDILLGLSTSGNSGNVVNAVKTARAFGLGTVGMTGQSGGVMKEICDVCITVPTVETYRVQEYHLPIYHALCAMLEAEFFCE